MGDEEDDAGDEEAPYAAGMEAFDEEVGADSWMVSWDVGKARGGNVPERRRPMKLQTERMETCICWRWTRKDSPTLGLKCFQRALASLPMLLGDVSGEVEMKEGDTYLMVIRPTPARMVMMEKSCQKSKLPRSFRPRISTR